ncbi:Uncharacterised protein [Mycobacterium tuberculosis]|uniref:Uncharacterized protein n=1 Tax=Mycobacterium tuberculosis TaxID=1773 RepID=A0A654U5T3_MYCTX|nr:Uncharacterised protein [Mycobacterium tuberculosis]CFS36070.1 Uncharacterised protein [Mycobacterium tuberculosis]COX67506.1 Uncharacterised protein [Mycobacterium tuberculosis]COY47993.1 Uncharacterised protein [Mycobacterium tuberculosis]COZ00019.1 Uncharacterised protein [Mycobacterium tuberculosis]
MLDCTPKCFILVISLGSTTSDDDVAKISKYSRAR